MRTGSLFAVPSHWPAEEPAHTIGPGPDRTEVIRELVGVATWIGGSICLGSCSQPTARATALTRAAGTRASEKHRVPIFSIFCIRTHNCLPDGVGFYSHFFHLKMKYGSAAAINIKPM